MAFQTIAILSPGNMGSAVGAHLVKAGYRVIADLGPRSEFTRDRAVEAGIEDAGSLDGLVAEADLVLSILAPQLAEETAAAVAAAMGRTGHAPAYADCNATSPATAGRLADIVGAAGARFIDVGILGGAPVGDKALPRFCISGPDAALFDELDGKGMKILHAGPQIGQGSALKICNGAFTKGAFALYTTVMLAAEHYGFTEILRPQLVRGQAGTVERLDSAIPRLASLSGRYEGEMEQVADALAAIGLPRGFHDGAAELFARMAKTDLAAERREEIDPERGAAEALALLAAALAGEKPPG